MYDFAIVGSGPGGGVLAKNLHDSGAKVLLIEAGKFLRKDTFPRTESEYSSQLFWGGGIEFDVHAKTAFLRARVVGGTSIVNQALMNRFDEEAFRDWKERSGVDYFNVEAMTPYYDKAEGEIKMHTFNEDDFTRNTEIFTDACDKIGYKWKFLRRGMEDCRNAEGNDCIGCLGGCHRDSKQSTLVASIQVAEKTGMEVSAETTVERVVHKPDHVVLHCLKEGKKIEITAAKAILSAGSFGSTKIMLKSGFGDKLPYLGEGFCQHPQYMSFGLFDEPVNAHKRAFQTVASGDPNMRKAGFKLENVYAPPISIGMLFNVWGPDHQELMMNYTKMACIEAAVRDQPEGGKIELDKKGNLSVTKSLTDQDQKRRDAGLEAIDNILATAGAKKIVRSPFFFGLHLMGGCSIGTDARKSVVDPEFKVHGMNNLYISDSSLFPSAPGINPSLTIMTMSHKLSEQLTK